MRCRPRSSRTPSRISVPIRSMDGIDVGRLHERLVRTRRPVKVALLDQTVLAGIGNIYATEALFLPASIPRAPASASPAPRWRDSPAASAPRSIGR